MRGGSSSAGCRQNRLAHAVDVDPHRVVVKADHLEPKPLQDRCPHLIRRPALLVLPTVQFHDEPSFQADEIGDELADRVLAAKLQAREPSTPQAPP